MCPHNLPTAEQLVPTKSFPISSISTHSALSRSLSLSQTHTHTLLSQPFFHLPAEPRHCLVATRYTRACIQALICVAAKGEVLFQDAQHLHHLGEYQNLGVEKGLGVSLGLIGKGNTAKRRRYSRVRATAIRATQETRRVSSIATNICGHE